MYEQLDIFAYIERPHMAGDWVEADVLGEELTFDEIAERVGSLIIMDKSTESHKWYQVVHVEWIEQTADGRRLVYCAGKAGRYGYVDEWCFGKSRVYRCHAYRIAERETKEAGQEQTKQQQKGGLHL